MNSKRFNCDLLPLISRQQAIPLVEAPKTHPSQNFLRLWRAEACAMLAFLILCGGILFGQAQAAPSAVDDPVASIYPEITELLRAAQYKAAESLLKSVMNRFEDKAQPYSMVLNCLGYVYQSAGDYDRAETQYRMAIATGAELLKNGDVRMLAPVSNLLGLYLAYRQTGKAERLVQKLDRIAPAWRTAQDANSARLYCLSAILQMTLHKFNEAEPLLVRADELLTLNQTSRDSDRAAVLNYLALLYFHTGRGEKALEGARRLNDLATANAEHAFDSVHRALFLMNLAVVELQTGHAEDAKHYFEEGKKMAGPGGEPLDPTLAEVLSAGAGYLKEAGRKHEAKELSKRADFLRTAIARSTSIGKTVDYLSFR